MYNSIFGFVLDEKSCIGGYMALKSVYKWCAVVTLLAGFEELS